MISCCSLPINLHDYTSNLRLSPTHDIFSIRLLPRVGVLILCNPFHSFPSKNTKFSIQVRFEVVRHVIKRQETGKYCNNSSREENVGGLHVRSFYGSTNQFTREKYNKVK